MTNKWLNPTDYKTDQEFIRAYDADHGKASAVSEIIQLIDGAESRIAGIKKQMDLIKNGSNYGI